MKIISTFVHGYNDLSINLPDIAKPSLLVINNSKQKVYSYIFPRNPDDFKKYKNLIAGSTPLKNSKSFKKLPRFGFTGISKCGDKIYCASWNSVYQINLKNYKLEKIISNNFMSDMHGIYVNKKYIIHALTCKDTIVFSDLNGKIIKYFSINKKLEIEKNKNLEKTDWRFVSKQFKGSTGYFHFNYLYLDKDILWITCRNINAFILVNLKTMTAEIKTMNLSTPALMHDGIHYNKKIYLTSIDAKIIIAQNSKRNLIQHNREKVDNIKIYNRDLITSIIRLNKETIGSNPNWCRGIKVLDNIAYVTIDGRYDTELKFSIIKFDLKKKKLIKKFNFFWNEIDNEQLIRYCTGFDLILSKK